MEVFNRIWGIIRGERTFKVTDPTDKALLAMMTNCLVDEMTLPSGLKVPKAPDGYYYWGNQGCIVLRKGEWQKFSRSAE